MHLAWSGNTRILATRPPQGYRLLGAGELLHPGEIVLASGDSYTTPWVVGSWGEGLDALASRSHAHLRALPSHPARPRPVLLNSWEAVYFDHDPGALMSLADEAATIGIERFVLDDGWFGSRRDSTSGLGDWQVSPQAWPAGHMAVGTGGGARHGAPAVHDQTLALYRLLDALHERFPDLDVESCAGGGGRIDMGIMERTQRVWASDCNDAHDRADINRATMLLLPPELVGTHVGSGRDHTSLRNLDLPFRAGQALWGHMGVEWDLRSASQEDKRALAALIAVHKNLRPLLHAGELVHADTDEDEAVRIEGVVSPDRTDALYQLTGLAQTTTWPGAPRPLPGLDSARIYHVRLATPRLRRFELSGRLDPPRGRAAARLLPDDHWDRSARHPPRPHASRARHRAGGVLTRLTD